MSPDWSFPRAEALPTYAFVATDEIKANARARGVDLIDLGLGNPDRPTPSEIIDQLERAARIGRNHRYHPGRGLFELRRALTRWYDRRYQTRFDVEHEVIVTMGAKEGISHLALAILDRGDVAIVPDPCYPIHMGAPLIAGASIERYPVAQGIEPAAAIAAAIARVKAAGGRPKLVITCYPHNPTGQVVTHEQLGALVKVVRDSGAFLLHDNAYADLDFQSRYAPSIFACGVDRDEVAKFAVEVFSMSKSYNMPGWRVAYMVGCSRLIDALAHMKTYMDYGTFMPLQYASAWALDNGDHLVEHIRNLYRERATNLVGELRRAGWDSVPEPGGTMFVWARLPPELAGSTSIEAVGRLIDEAHVAVSPGSGFGPGGEGYVRFALIEDPPRIADAATRIRDFLQRCRSAA